MPWEIVGHTWAVDALSRDLAAGRVRHAYLFAGPDGIGKRTLAGEFARALLCQAPDRPCGVCRVCRLVLKNAHPDLLTVSPVISGKKVRAEKIQIEPVRQLIYDLTLKPVEAGRRVARLLDFDAANPQAMNALLKTLEEPPGEAILLLTADSPAALLPTIVSRCEVLELRPQPAALIQEALITRWLVPQAQAELLAHLSGGRLGWAVRLHADPDALEERAQKLDDLRRLLSASRVERFAYADRLARENTSDRLQDTLALWSGFWRDVLLAGAAAAAPLTNLDRAAEINLVASLIPPNRARLVLSALGRTSELLSRNVNARLALEVLLLDWPRL